MYGLSTRRAGLLCGADWLLIYRPDVHFHCDVDYDPFLYMEDHNKTYGAPNPLFASSEHLFDGLFRVHNYDVRVRCHDTYPLGYDQGVHQGTPGIRCEEQRDGIHVG